MLKTIAVTTGLLIFLCSFSVLIYSSKPPQGYTGADGVTCTSCHTGNALNSDGGSVTVSGLPSGNYIAGAVYNFSITINHANTDRRRWGFEIAARNSSNKSVGVFSTTNANAEINGLELAHLNAVSTPAQNSYTYNNLIWTAPLTPAPADESITFFYAGNAASGSGSDNDFIYNAALSASYSVVYSFTGNGNWNNPANWSNNTIPPAVLSGNAQILIDPPTDGECVLNVSQTISGTAKLTVQAGKKFRVAGNLIINQQ